MRYEGSEILKGKYQIPGLPAFYEENPGQAETLVITMKNERKNILVKLFYGVFEELDLLTRTVSVENCGRRTGVSGTCHVFMFGSALWELGLDDFLWKT